MKTARYNRLKLTPEGRALIAADNKRKWEQRSARQRAAKEREREQLADGILPPPPPAAADASQTEIVAIDGEGVTTPDGRHKYILLSASIGEQLRREKGIRTEAALRWLLDLARPGRRIVGFALTYDVNMMLRDIGQAAQDALIGEGSCYYTGKQGRYRITWLPGKSIAISEITWHEGGTQTLRSVLVWDVFGFFQCSFLRALEDWGVGTAAEREQIREGKGLREAGGAYTRPLSQYNLLECGLLVQLVRAVETALADAGTKIRRWDGAGAIASSLLHRMQVESHRPGTAEIPRDAVMGAYFGARSQALQIGRFPRESWHYDLRSAYPSAMLELPLLKGQWRTAYEYEPGARWAIWHVGWDLRNNPHYPLTPFPHRGPDRSISYPAAGCGVYWSPLVAAAVRGWGDKIKILLGFVWEPEDEKARPFAGIRAFYNRRRELAEEKPGAARVLKLGMNAIYGKLAQGSSFRGDPPFRSFEWAGLITATIHARMLDAALLSPTDIIAITVDALWSRRRLALPLGEGLGEWSEESAEDLFLLGPATYARRGAIHASGFRSGEFPLESLRAGWERERWTYHEDVIVRRFLGLQLAAARGQREDWGQWQLSRRRICCCPSSGTAGPESGPESIYWLPPRRLAAPSMPYVPKGRLLDDDEDAQEYALLMSQPDPIL